MIIVWPSDHEETTRRLSLARWWKWMILDGSGVFDVQCQKSQKDLLRGESFVKQVEDRHG
jgi:hypothetical protein